MVWKMVFEEFVNGFSMLDPLCYLNVMISTFCITYLPAASHQVSAQEDKWFGKCWLKNSKMAVKC